MYDGDDEWHERLLLGHVRDNNYVVATPTFDVFVETIDAGNPDLSSIRIGPAGGGLPLGVDAGRLF
eukprot:5411326-Karenia_brevis.AAC.1